MSDDLQSRGGRDRPRINIHQDHELRDWSERFGVSKEQLKEAVQAVGDEASRVEQHLRGGASRPRPAGSDKPR